MKELKNQETHDKAVEKKTYTVAEVQTMLSCGRETVYELLRKREFRWFRIGTGKGFYRISRESFDEWLNKQM